LTGADPHGTIEGEKAMKTKHGRCREACTKAMGILRKPYHRSTRIEITVRELNRKGEYEAFNLFGTVWTGKACCKWRARARAAKVLASRRKS